MKFLVLISDEWSIAICRSSLLFGIFIMKKWVVLNITFFGTEKYECVIKAKDIFIFIPLINSSATIELSFLVLIISAIIASNTISILFSLSG